MKTPAYVPDVVKKQAEHYLEGSTRGDWEGWLKVIEFDKDRLTHLKNIRKYKDDLPPDRVKKLSKEINELALHIDNLEQDISCIKRLVLDDRMKDTYQLLHTQNYSDKELDLIIHAAWTSKADYGQYRDALFKAKETKNKIASTAKKLSRLLDEIYNAGIEVEAELSHIPSLISATKHKEKLYNSSIWESVKKYITADVPYETLVSLDKAAKVHNDVLQYSWEKAPYVSSLIDAIALAAENYEPVHNSEMVKGATIGRERNIKTEYIRALATRLLENKLNLNTILMKAIAIITNVVIDSPDIDTSYDDVRKAVEKLNKLNLEDSA